MEMNSRKAEEALKKHMNHLKFLLDLEGKNKKLIRDLTQEVKELRQKYENETRKRDKVSGAL